MMIDEEIDEVAWFELMIIDIYNWCLSESCRQRSRASSCWLLKSSPSNWRATSRISNTCEGRITSSNLTSCVWRRNTPRMSRTTARRKTKRRRKRKLTCISLLRRSTRSHSRRQKPSRKPSRRAGSNQTPSLKPCAPSSRRQIWPSQKSERMLTTSKDRSWWVARTAEQATSKPSAFKNSLRRRTARNALWSKNTRTKRPPSQPKSSRPPTKSQRSRRWATSSSSLTSISCRSKTRSTWRRSRRRIRSCSTPRSVQARSVLSYSRRRRS